MTDLPSWESARPCRAKRRACVSCLAPVTRVSFLCGGGAYVVFTSAGGGSPRDEVVHI